MGNIGPPLSWSVACSVSFSPTFGTAVCQLCFLCNVSTIAPIESSLADVWRSPCHHSHQISFFFNDEGPSHHRVISVLVVCKSAAVIVPLHCSCNNGIRKRYMRKCCHYLCFVHCLKIFVVLYPAFIIATSLIVSTL